MSGEEHIGGRDEEFRITEDDGPPGVRIPMMRVIKQEVLVSTCDPDRMLEDYGITEGGYSLDSIDESAVENLKGLLASNPDYRRAADIRRIVERAECNSSYDIFDPDCADNLFDTDPACGAIYACNEILDSLAYVLGITEQQDNASYALCILKAVDDGIIAPGEVPEMTRLFEYRHRCATVIDVETPDPGSVDVWKAVLYRTMSMMFKKAEERGQGLR